MSSRTFKLAVAAAILSLFGAAPAFAWDCSNPANWTLNVPGNECYRPATSTQTQGQGQSQTQTAKGGKGGSASAVGGAGGAGGSGGEGGVGGAGGASNATGGNQSQTQSSASTSNNAGNAQSTSYASNYTEVRQAVDGYSSGTNSTASCTRDQHAGLGTIIGGISFGRGKRDSDCARQLLADAAWRRGNDAAAVRLYCSIREVHEALGADCETLMARPVVPQVAPPTAQAVPQSDYVTRADLIEVERRITTHLGSK